MSFSSSAIVFTQLFYPNNFIKKVSFKYLSLKESLQNPQWDLDSGKITGDGCVTGIKITNLVMVILQTNYLCSFQKYGNSIENVQN